MNIAVDIDDTLTNSFTYFQPYVAEYFGVELSKLQKKNISYSNLPIEWKKDELDFSKKYFDDIVPDTPFKEDAAWGMRTLHNLGHRLIVITGRNNLLYTDAYKTTQQELQNGEIFYDKLICTLDKAKACQEENISIFIDDLLANCESVAQVGISPIVFNTLANQSDQTEFSRVDDWSQVIQTVKKCS